MKNVMILAAGRGERLKPLTNRIPKAMCLVNGTPLIEHHVKKLSELGFENIVINHAYLGDQIRHHLGDGRRWNVKIQYSPEQPGGLETGGGIYNALPLLGKEPFITVNADIFTDFDFDQLHLPEGSQVHLVLGKNPFTDRGNFGLDADNRLTHETDYTYLGIACYDPCVFNDYQLGRYSVVPMLRTLVDKKRITGELYRGKWIDIGSPSRLALANQAF